MAQSDPGISALGPQGRKARLQELWLRQLAGLAVWRPVLMLLEDAHWLDPSSLEQFELVVHRIRPLRVLLLVTFRPEFEQSWAHHPHATVLSLDRFGSHHSVAVVEGLTGGGALPAPVLAQIVAKADGGFWRNSPRRCWRAASSRTRSTSGGYRSCPRRWQSRHPCRIR